MTKIEIEIPKDIELKAKMLNVELSFFVVKATKERLEELEKIEHFKKIVAKSKATDKDVEELTDKIKTAVWKHHEKYFK